MLILVCLSAFLHLSSRPQRVEGALQIVSSEGTCCIETKELAKADVKGELLKANGKTLIVNAKGVSLQELLARYAFQSLTAFADDAYSVVLQKDQLKDAYIIVEETMLRLIVFGGLNSKLNVKDLIRLELH